LNACGKGWRQTSIIDRLDHHKGGVFGPTFSKTERSQMNAQQSDQNVASSRNNRTTRLPLHPARAHSRYATGEQRQLVTI